MVEALLPPPLQILVTAKQRLALAINPSTALGTLPVPFDLLPAYLFTILQYGLFEVDLTLAVYPCMEYWIQGSGTGFCHVAAPLSTASGNSW